MMATTASRIWNYVNVMAPPAALIPAGIIKFLALYLGFQALTGKTELNISPGAWAGAVTMVLLILLTRVYDEFKDAEADIRLGKAGDPRYADRPIVTGAVLIEDIAVLRNGIIITLLLLNVWMPPITLMGFALVFGLLWLSSKWFFYPKIADSLLLALLTHNPLGFLLQVYAYTLFLGEGALAQIDLAWAAFMLGMYVPWAAWETSRKQRIPEDETDYETYTKIWGMKVAPLVPAVLIAISAAGLLVAGASMGLGTIWQCIIIAAALIPIGACLRFWAKPTSENSKLQPFSEAYLMAVDLSVMVGLMMHHNVTLL